MSDPLSVNHSRIPYRGQLISPPAPTSLEYPSKSVAGARYVDLRKSPRSSNEDHRGWEGGGEEEFSIGIYEYSYETCPSSSSPSYVRQNCCFAWGGRRWRKKQRYHTSLRRNSPVAISGRGGNPSKDRGHDATLIGEGLIRHSATGHWRGLLVL